MPSFGKSEQVGMSVGRPRRKPHTKSNEEVAIADNYISVADMAVDGNSMVDDIGVEDSAGVEGFQYRAMNGGSSVGACNDVEGDSDSEGEIVDMYDVDCYYNEEDLMVDDIDYLPDIEVTDSFHDSESLDNIYSAEIDVEMENEYNADSTEATTIHPVNQKMKMMETVMREAYLEKPGSSFEARGSKEEEIERKQKRQTEAVYRQKRCKRQESEEEKEQRRLKRRLRYQKEKERARAVVRSPIREMNYKQKAAPIEVTSIHTVDQKMHMFKTEKHGAHLERPLLLFNTMSPGEKEIERKDKCQTEASYEQVKCKQQESEEQKEQRLVKRRLRYQRQKERKGAMALPVEDILQKELERKERRNLHDRMRRASMSVEELTEMRRKNNERRKRKDTLVPSQNQPAIDPSSKKQKSEEVQGEKKLALENLQYDSLGNHEEKMLNGTCAGELRQIALTEDTDEFVNGDIPIQPSPLGGLSVEDSSHSHTIHHLMVETLSQPPIVPYQKIEGSPHMPFTSDPNAEEDRQNPNNRPKRQAKIPIRFRL